MAEKQLETTTAASAFQKQWFADLRRRVFDERQPYALLQADVPFELFDLLEIPAVSNQWWASIVAAKRQAPRFLEAMEANGLHGSLCRYCSLGLASTRYPWAGEPPWGGLPTPRLLCARLTCDCIHRVFELWANAFGAELFEIDHPVPAGG
jgi:benzoyl-CoA reductase subunit B